MSKVQKVKDSVGASIKLGVDYVSLTRNGLSPDQATRLQRALYVHTVGFYDIVMESCQASLNKKNLVVGVMRAYQQLLERCQKIEWRMLIGEVAKTYEAENHEKQSKLRETIQRKDQIIAKLRQEIAAE